MFDIKKFVEVKEDPESGVWVPWDEEDGCLFKIGYAGRKRNAAASLRATEKIMDKRHRMMPDKFDVEKYNVELMRQVILDWKGLRVKHMVQILDPDRTRINARSEDMETEVPYSEEARDFIVEQHNSDFYRFIQEVSINAEKYRQLKDEELRKNSQTSQSGQETSS